MVLIQGELRHFPRMAQGALKKCIDTLWPRTLFPILRKVDAPKVAIRFEALDTPLRLLENRFRGELNDSKKARRLPSLKVGNHDVVVWSRCMFQSHASAIPVNSQSVRSFFEGLAVCAFSLHLDGNS